MERETGIAGSTRSRLRIAICFSSCVICIYTKLSHPLYTFPFSSGYSKKTSRTRTVCERIGGRFLSLQGFMDASIWALWGGFNTATPVRRTCPPFPLPLSLPDFIPLQLPNFANVVSSFWLPGSTVHAYIHINPYRYMHVCLYIVLVYVIRTYIFFRLSAASSSSNSSSKSQQKAAPSKRC